MEHLPVSLKASYEIYYHLTIKSTVTNMVINYVVWVIQSLYLLGKVFLLDESCMYTKDYTLNITSGAVTQALNVSKWTLQWNLKQLSASFYEQFQLAYLILMLSLMKALWLSLTEIIYLLGICLILNLFNRRLNGMQSPSVLSSS